MQRKTESGEYMKEGEHAKIFLRFFDNNYALRVFKRDSYQLSSSLQRDRAEARFSERLPIGPPWRLRGRVSLILAGAPEDKQTSVLCYWRGAEPAEAFTKASALSHSYSPLPRLTLLHHVVLTFSLSPSFPLSVSYTDVKHLSLFLSLLSLSCLHLNFSLFLSLLRQSMIIQKVLNKRERLLHDLGHNSHKFLPFEDFIRLYRPIALNHPTLSPGATIH